MDTAKVSSQAAESPRPPHPFLMLFAAAALTLVLCAVVLGPRAMADQVIPEQDLRIARLSSVAQLVTPFQIRSVDGGRTITLIGAYADPARTVVFLRISPNLGWPDLTVSDGQGGITSGGNVGGKGDYANGAVGVPAAPSDYVATLDHGPGVGPDNIAHLTVQVTGLLASPLYSSQIPVELHGSWTLSFALPVQPAIALPHESAFQMGSLKITIEVLDVTPSAIHLQAVVDGAGVEEVGRPRQPPISLLDPSGKPLVADGLVVVTTTSKEQLNPATGPPSGARVNMHWIRPRSAGTYKLRFQLRGQVHTIPLSLPAP